MFFIDPSVKPKDENRGERGSVFFYVLLAIALFAALTYAVSRDKGGSTNIFTDKQAKLAAQEIIEYGNTVANAVQKLRLRGCTDTQISFENDIVAGYTNPNAPSDKSCHVFDINGGSIQFQQAPEPYANTGPLHYEGKYSFIYNTEWVGNGTTCGDPTCGDLLLILQPLDENICEVINKHLGYSTLPEDTAYGGVQFTGIYSATYNTLADEANGAEVIGKSAACFLRTNDNAYIYTQVLIAR